MDLEAIARDIVHAAIQVHKALGPGLLESAYEKCLAYELGLRNHQVECQVSQPIQYQSVFIDCAYRIDMLVDQAIIVENKCVEKILPIHEAQLMTYMKLRDARLGFILNWYTPLMKQGIHRFVNKYQELPKK